MGRASKDSGEESRMERYNTPVMKLTNSSRFPNFGNCIRILFLTAMPLPLGTSTSPAKLGFLRKGESTPSRQDLLQVDLFGTGCNTPAPREGILRSSAVLDGHDVPRRKMSEEVRPSRILLPSPVSACPHTLPVAAAPWHPTEFYRSARHRIPEFGARSASSHADSAKLRLSWGGRGR